MKPTGFAFCWLCDLQLGSRPLRDVYNGRGQCTYKMVGMNKLRWKPCNTTNRLTSVDPLWLFPQPTLSSIAAGKLSLGILVFASSRSTNVRAYPPMLLLPCFSSHKTKSLTTSSPTSLHMPCKRDGQQWLAGQVNTTDHIDPCITHTNQKYDLIFLHPASSWDS